ncbi:rho GTPase-activating protein 39-like [Hydractinia symbiolongicarpus]|uniref:rho GTPase-activating protein 39-like n=1 Tax=Hydractinia symbiolongicarpus TaxID=13093 RepID=UPI00254B5E2C|nr:rho GTPase-activating protein 39-like [Hydractinia symbiolongicarpus]
MGERFEWVEIIEPSRQEHMFANLKTGQCLWEPPDGVIVKPTHENQWWELYDSRTRKYYYYNATSQKTVWRRPKDGDIIPLAKLQMLKAKEVEKKNTNISKEISNTSLEEIDKNNSVDDKAYTGKSVNSSEHPYEDINSNSNLVEQTKEAQKAANELQISNSTEDNSPIDSGVNIENVKNNVNTSNSLIIAHEPDNMLVSEKFPEEPVYQNVNFEVRESKEMEAMPTEHFVSPKSATLPRTSVTQPIAEKPKFNSVRNKAPPKKPPRTLTNVVVDLCQSKELMAMKRSPRKETSFENKENASYVVTMESSPSLTRKLPSEKPSQPPTQKPLNVKLAMSDATNIRKVKGSSPPPPTSPKPTSVGSPVPPAPPLPAIPAGSQRLHSVYDNVNNTMSMYDNVSDNDDLDETQNSAMSTSPRLRNISGSSDENTTPSGTLLRTETAPPGNRTSCYERLNDDDTPSDPPSSSQSPRNPHQSDSDRSPPAKRSPLTRMKSDPSDMEKKAKLSKISNAVHNSQFRPVSMMNLSSGSSTLKAKRLSSESDIPEKVPLNTHRRGLFRRKMSIHSMLSWSKTQIKKPMVLTRNKQLRKDAVDVFKLILQYMGDKSTRKSLDTLSVDLTTRGWSTPALRDEIFIQLCKQTTHNEKPTSLKRGWELITACLSIFPPSSKFHSYLEGYISRNLDDESNNPQAQVEMYAKYCYKQLERICQTGAKRGLKGPTVDEIHAAIKRVFNPSLFGNALEDIMEMQQERYPDYRLPWILTTLTDAVLIQNGLQTEGIFRVPGDIDEVNSLKVMIDNWNFPEHLTDPHIPASLLKLWFRDLFEPLIPQKFYDQCIHNCDNQDICLNIVNSLPPLNNLVFSYLIRLLQAFMIPENVSISKMDENNLAMVWAPNCLRCPSDDPREIFENTRKEMTFLRTVMQSLDTSFLEGVV